MKTSCPAIYTPAPEILEQFSLYEPIFPDWLKEYINAPELLRLYDISMDCGTNHSKILGSPRFFYSNLDHSVGVALIIWHFTRDKKQTLAGLFHDISTPAFKHCIDVMNGDALTQESTEGPTHDVIKNSAYLSKLLKRDHIKIGEVDNYHLYPIADNDTPKLSADRLEYSLSNAYFRYRKLDFDSAAKFYRDIQVVNNEQGVPELAFQTKKLAVEFVKLTTELALIYRCDASRYSMRLIAEIFRKLSRDGKIQKSDLYRLSENEAIDLIKNSNYAGVYASWCNATEVKASSLPPRDAFSVNESHKVRYIDPLVDGARASADPLAKQFIRDNFAYEMNKYVYVPGITGSELA